MTMDPRPESIFGYPVVFELKANPGTLLPGPTKGCLHTTETSGPAGYAAGDFPNMEISKSKLRMFYGFDEAGKALRHDPANNPGSGETNNRVWQAEIVGFSSTSPWLPDTETLKRIYAVVAYASQFHGIPLVRWNPAWGDDLSDVSPFPASDNSRRKYMESRWTDAKGWGGHIEVPWQKKTNHWDPGALKWTDVFKGALALMDPADEEDDVGKLSGQERDGLAGMWGFQRRQKVGPTSKPKKGEYTDGDGDERLDSAIAGWEIADKILK